MFQNKVSVAFFPETNPTCRTLDENELEERLKKILKGELEPDDETTVNLLLQQVALANKLPGSSFDLIDQFLRRNEPTKRTTQPDTRFLKHILTSTIKHHKKEHTLKNSDRRDEKSRQYEQKEKHHTQDHHKRHSSQDKKHTDNSHSSDNDRHNPERENAQTHLGPSRKRSRSPSSTETRDSSPTKQPRTETLSQSEQHSHCYDHNLPSSPSSLLSSSQFPKDSITNIKNNSNSLPKSRVTIDDDEDDALLQRLMSVEKRGRGGVGSSVMERTFSEDRLVFDGNDVVAADDNRVSISTISTKEKDKKKKKRDKKLKKKLKKEKKKQKLMKKLQKQMEENKSS